MLGQHVFCVACKTQTQRDKGTQLCSPAPCACQLPLRAAGSPAEGWAEGALRCCEGPVLRTGSARHCVLTLRCAHRAAELGSPLSYSTVYLVFFLLSTRTADRRAQGRKKDVSPPSLG